MKTTRNSPTVPSQPTAPAFHDLWMDAQNQMNESFDRMRTLGRLIISNLTEDDESEIGNLVIDLADFHSDKLHDLHVRYLEQVQKAVAEAGGAR